MTKFFLTALLVILSASSDAQSFFNGDFENNSAISDLINLSNSSFNSYMSDCYAFGSNGNVDIITSTSYCSMGPENGNWYIALTGGGTDIVSVKINQALTQGASYTVSFYDRFCDVTGSYINHAFVFGLSAVPDSFGTEIYTASKPTEDVWTQKGFTFTAPLSDQYLTIMVDSGNSFSTWELIDNISFAGKGTGIPQLSGNALIVYPNPSNGILNIACTIPYHQIRIYNSIGLLISDQVMEDGNQLKTLDLSHLADGIYWIEIFDRENQIMTREEILKHN